MVLLQGRAALPAGPQPAHQLGVGLLAPRLKLDLAARMAALRPVVALSLVGGGEGAERLKGNLAQLLAHYQRPLLERAAVGQAEAVEEIAAVERDCLLQARQAGRAGFERPVAVGAAGVEQLPKRQHIQRVVAGGVELDGMARGLEEGECGLAQGAPQVGQRDPQIVARGLLVGLGPEQRQQRIAAGAVTLLDRKVDQQGQMLARAQGDRRAIGARDLRRAEQAQAELGRGALAHD